jgi:hypothetical protein
MSAFTSLELAELHRHELRSDAADARLAARSRRARRQGSRLDWLRHVASRRPRLSRTPSAKPAVVTSTTPRHPFDDLASELAANGPAATRDDLTRFVELAAASGATPSLLSVLADRDQPDVARQRAFGRLAVELAAPMSDSVPRSGESHAA